MNEDIPPIPDIPDIDSPFDESCIAQGECSAPNKSIKQKIKEINMKQLTATSKVPAAESKPARYEKISSPELRLLNPPTNESFRSEDGEDHSHNRMMRLKTSNCEN